jgi:TetR/AcrR family fatty acid metabolism transcriptional regulator
LSLAGATGNRDESSPQVGHSLSRLAEAMGGVKPDADHPTFAARQNAVDANAAACSNMNESSFISGSDVPATAPARQSRPVRPPRLSLTRGVKRDAILRAAIQVFAGRGFFHAQVADVARAAGVAAGTVYLYFKGKDDLLVSIFERTMDEAIAEGRAALDGVTDPVERLRRIARLHLDRLGRDRDLAVVFQVELRQSTKFMAHFSATKLREYLGILREVIVRGQDAGVLRSDVNPTVAAKVLFGALDEMATNWILSRRRYPLVADADAVVDIFLHGVQS